MAILKNNNGMGAHSVQQAANAYKNSMSGARNEVVPTVRTTPKYTSTAIPTGNAGYAVSAVASQPKSKPSSNKKPVSQKPATTAPVATTPPVGNGSVSSKGLQTQYDTPAWYTDEWDRQRQNAQQYAKAGINYELKEDPVTGIPAINYALGQNIGAIAADPTGGTYDYYGYSNNPNFLKATIGLTRDQVEANETLAGLSDRALYEIYTQGMQNYNPVTGGMFENGSLYGNLYYNPYSQNNSELVFGGGGISSFKGNGAVSVADVRKALAELTNQKATYAEDLGGWWGGTLVPFVKPDYYAPNADLGARQQSEIIDPYVQKIMAMLSSQGGSGGAVASAPSNGSSSSDNTPETTKPSAYDEELRKYIQQMLTGRLI